MPHYGQSGAVAIFTVEFAAELSDASHGGFPVKVCPRALARSLNLAINDAIGWGRREDMVPKPSDLQAELVAFAAECKGLLSRMGLNEHGTAPVENAVRTTRTQSWYQWLRQGQYGLLTRNADPDPAVSRPALYRLVRAEGFAEHIVPIAVGHDAVAHYVAMHSEHGLPVTDDEKRHVQSVAMIEAAMERAAPMLSLLALLASEAADRPIAGAKKGNFDREFRASLFIGLANTWFETFGELPRGHNADRQPGGPAHTWIKKILAEAHDMSGTLPDDAQTALKQASGLSDATIADRIDDAVKRSQLIHVAQSRNRAD